MQQLGETRQAMTRKLMEYIEGIINTVKRDEFYILVHGKPWPCNPNIIKQKILVMDRRPSMMLSCMLFKANKKQGKLTLEWALPGDWPTWSVGGTNEPVPETIASYDALDKKLKMAQGNQFFESDYALSPI
jgi:hypothetical protein